MSRQGPPSERRRQLPYGIKATIVEDDDDEDTGEITSPVELLLETDLEPEDVQVVERLRRDSQDPYEMILKVAKVQRRDRVRARKEKSGVGELGQQVANAINSQAAATRILQAKVEKLEKPWSWLRAIAMVLLIPALGAIVTGVGLMVSHAKDDGENKAIQQRLQQDVQQLLLNQKRSP
jgi:hypothetical protein